MSETKALLRLALIQNRLSLICVIAFVVIGVSASLFWGAGSINPDVRGVAMVILVVTMLPAAVWTLALFDFSSGAELMERSSGYSPWLLRSPIASWKLAIVPVILKTVWAVGVWIAFALTVRIVNGYPLALISPAFCFASVGVWFFVLSWRPFSSGWWRLGAIIAGGLVLYGCFAGAMIAQDPRPTPLQARFAPLLSSLGFIVYALGVWMSMRAVDLARTNSAGLIAAHGKSLDRNSSKDDSASGRIRHYQSPQSALIWHDLTRSREYLRNFVLLGVIPGLVLSWLVLPLNIITFVLITVVFAYIGVGTSTFVSDLAKPNITGVLRPYMAASPLGTATIAWTRLLVTLAIMTTVMLLSLVAFGGMLLWAENRATFNEWSAQMTMETGWSYAGWRIGGVMILGSWIVIIGRSVAYWWSALSGKSWLHITVACFIGAGYFLPMIIGGYWFAQQTDWESTAESARYWAGFVPPILVTWLILKLIGCVAAVIQLRKLNLVSPRSIGLMIGGWSLITVLAAVTLDRLVPHHYGSFVWCFAGVAVCLPLVRVLVLPISLYFGRHQ